MHQGIFFIRSLESVIGEIRSLSSDKGFPRNRVGSQRPHPKSLRRPQRPLQLLPTLPLPKLPVAQTLFPFRNQRETYDHSPPRIPKPTRRQRRLHPIRRAHGCCHSHTRIHPQAHRTPRIRTSQSHAPTPPLSFQAYAQTNR